MEVVVITEAIRHAKLQSDHHQQQTNSHLFTDEMPSRHQTNCDKAL